MTSTDDTRDSPAHGDDTTEESSADVFVEPIRRRSTYTPPPQYARAAQEPADVPAQEPIQEPAQERTEEAPPAPSAQPATPPAADPIPLPPVWGSAPPAPAAPEMPTATPAWDAPLSDLPARGAPAPEAPPYVPWTPEPFDNRSTWGAPTAVPEREQESEPASDDASRPQPQHRGPLPEQTEPPRFMTPDEEAATLALHAPPLGQPWIPQRRSLPDDELVDVLDAAGHQPGGTLDAIDALENEMRLREEEKQEYREWEDSMLAVGTPEALAAVAQVRPTFTSIVVPPELEPTPTSAIPVQNNQADDDADSPRTAPPTAPAAAVTPSAPPEPPHPEPEVPLPADTAALFGADEYSASTITGQHEVVAALVSDAATEAAAAVRQPEPDLEPDTAPAAERPTPVEADEYSPSTITGQHAVIAALVTEAASESAAAVQQPAPDPEADTAFAAPPLFTAAPLFADRPAFAEQSSAPAEPERDFDALLSGGAGTGAGADGDSAAAGRRTEPVADSTVDDIAAFFAAATGALPAEPAHTLGDSDTHGAADTARGTDTPAGTDTSMGTDTPGGAPAPGGTATPVGGVLASPAASGASRPTRASAASAAVAPSTTAERPPLFAVEQSGAAPTPAELRVGRASRLFWLWFAANSSVVSIAFGAMVFSLGMSLRQSIMAILAGVALSFIPLGLGTLAGKRSGQPAVIVSRASFGLAGNIVPALLALVTRVFWGAVLLWLFASSIAGVLVSTGADGGLGYDSLVFLWLVVGVVLAGTVAFFGYALFARVQLVVSVLSAVLIVGFVALTADRIDVQTALTVVDGPWTLVVTGAVLVFSFVGLVWANSSSDLARYQRPSSPGSTSMLWAGFGTAVPTFLLIAYGALLASSDPALAAGLVAQPIDTLASILPSWYPIPLIAATALGLLSGVIVIVYSGAFALQGVGLRLERQWSTVLVAVLLLVLAVVFSLLTVDLTGLFRDLATTLAVPVAAWVGIFAADAMIRTRRYHSSSLLRPGGLYPNVNWVNLGALLAITVLGYGLTTATVTLLSWQGYLFALGGAPLDGELAGTDLGVLVALLLGILTPIVSGIPAIRRQEGDAR